MQALIQNSCDLRLGHTALDSAAPPEVEAGDDLRIETERLKSGAEDFRRHKARFRGQRSSTCRLRCALHVAAGTHAGDTALQCSARLANTCARGGGGDESFQAGCILARAFFMKRRSANGPTCPKTCHLASQTPERTPPQNPPAAGSGPRNTAKFDHFWAFLTPTPP